MNRLVSLSLLVSSLPCVADRGPVPGISTATPYLIYYGNWDAGKVDAARNNYDLVILHPISNITPADIATIRRGPDDIADTTDDVLVLAYISAGEDDRPAAPVAGDGAGPRIDPRSSDLDPLAGISPLGDPSPGGTGFASYYLDDEDEDGQPDLNSTFGGAFVNPGDPAWFQVMKNNVKATDGVAGLDEIMTTTTGLGYGCDGVFLDTLDTPAPNSFGATLYEWTAPAYQQLVETISDTYPDKLLLGNRGLFFYNPNLKTYAYTLRPHLNMILFESYYTDSSGSGAATAFFFDNKFNFAPKLNAEAERPDGFTILSLGYTNPGDPASLAEEDFFESQQEQGWPLYRTNPSLDSPFNTDAATWNSANPDNTPPVWDSTAAFSDDWDLGEAGNQPAPPEIGIQEVQASDGEVTLRWDIARDQTGPVKYNVYYTDQASLDFGTATKIPAVDVVKPDSYSSFIDPEIHPFEFTVTGLNNDTTYLFAVRAEDGLAQEDTNTVTLAATPQGIPSDFREISIDGDFSDWAGADVLDTDPAEAIDPDFHQVSVSNDADFLYIRFTLHSPAGAFVDFTSHLFLDTDDNPGTGFTPGGTTFGSEMMIEGATGYDQRGEGFNEGSVSSVAWSVANAATSEYEVRVSRAAIFDGDSQPVFDGDTIRLLLQNNAGDVTGSVRYQFAPTPPPPSEFATLTIDGDFSDWSAIPEILSDLAGDGVPDIVSVKAANDSDYLYLLVEYAAATDTNAFNGSPSNFISLDNDDNTATGFDIFSLGLIGAEVSWQNDFPFHQATGVYNTGATFTNAVPGISPYASNAVAQEYRIPLTATYDAGSGSQAVFPQDIIRLAMWSNDGVIAEFAGAFRYQLASPPPPAGYFSVISVDGDSSDWNSIPEVLSDPTGDGVPDIVSVKAANDDDWLYLLVEYAAASDTNNLNGSPSIYLSLDNDDNPATGFNVYGLGEVGAEVSWQNDFAFSQDTGVFNSGATFANAVPGISPYASNTKVQEYRIARTSTYDLGGGAQSIFPQDVIRLALWTDDGGSAEFAGAFRYSFTANPGTDAYTAWKALNFNASQLVDPLVSGDDADPDGDGLVNLAEFALGGTPFAFTASPIAATATIGVDRYLTLTYVQRTDGSVTVTPETSLSLSSWDDNPLQFVTISTAPAGTGFEEVTVRTNTPIPTSPNFLRLSIALNP